MYAQPIKILTACNIGWIRSEYLKRYIQRECREQGIDVVVTSTGIFPNPLLRLPRQVYDRADIVLSAEQRIENAITKVYGRNGQQFVNLDTLNVYLPNGDFSDFFLDLVLIGKSKKEARIIRDRPEIQDRIPLGAVLEQRNVMQYLRKD